MTITSAPAVSAVFSLDDEHHGATTLAELDVSEGNWTSWERIVLGSVDEVEVKPTSISRDGIPAFEVEFAVQFDIVGALARIIVEESGGDLSTEDAVVAAAAWWDDNSGFMVDTIRFIEDAIHTYEQDGRMYFGFFNQYPATATFDELDVAVRTLPGWREMQTLLEGDGEAALGLVRHAYLVVEHGLDI